MPDVQINRAVLADVDRIAPLFDAYRCFYGRSSDLDAARAFLHDRQGSGESTIYLAEIDGRPAGFVQLYPSFDSVDAHPIWILHDLFVDPGYRGRGIGRLLMSAARHLAEDSGAAGLSLATATDNHVAQGLYESLGYRRDSRFYHYFLAIRDATGEDQG
jgi:ribosomal protein S18 acetylase RimI-like enzyme